MPAPISSMELPAGGPPSASPLERELDHRIANSLQLAADFLLLQQTRLAEPAARAALAEAAERLVAVGHLHRFLCGRQAQARVDLVPFLDELAALIGAGTGLTCRVEAAPVQVTGGFAQQLGLAVNELALNAAKHAYARGEGGELAIRARLEDGRLRLSVADRGAGLGPGFRLDRSGGLGLDILRAIARQLGAELEARDEGGARFILKAPLALAAPGEPRSFAAPEGPD